MTDEDNEHNLKDRKTETAGRVGRQNYSLNISASRTSWASPKEPVVGEMVLAVRIYEVSSCRVNERIGVPVPVPVF